jgi:hypothetical protein
LPTSWPAWQRCWACQRAWSLPRSNDDSCKFLIMMSPTEDHIVELTVFKKPNLQSESLTCTRQVRLLLSRTRWHPLASNATYHRNLALFVILPPSPSSRRSSAYQWQWRCGHCGHC